MSPTSTKPKSQSKTVAKTQAKPQAKGQAKPRARAPRQRRVTAPTSSWDQFWRVFVTVALFAGALWVVQATADVLVPLILALLVAYMLDPIVRRLQGWLGGRRWLAVALTMGLAIAVVVGALAIIGPVLKHEAVQAVRAGQSLMQPDSELRRRLMQQVPPQALDVLDVIFHDPAVHKWMLESPELQSAILGGAKKLFPKLGELVAGALSALGAGVGALLVLVYVVFIMMDLPLLQRSWPHYVPPGYRDTAQSFVADADAVMATYFRGQVLVAATVGVLFAIGFTIAGVKMALLLGLALGVLNLIPYLQLLGLLPAYLLGAIAAVEAGTSVWGMMLAVSGVFVVVQALQDVVIAPRIMGRATGLRPVVILACVLFWGKLLGFLGLLLAIPLTTLVVVHYRRFVAQHMRAA